MIACGQTGRIGAGLMLGLALLTLAAPAASAAEAHGTFSVSVIVLPTCEVSAREDDAAADIRCSGGAEAAGTSTTRTASPLAEAERTLVDSSRETDEEDRTTWVTVSY